ncbi:hypothetical protein ACFL54_00355 [Planctomycetota bacterium]
MIKRSLPLLLIFCLAPWLTMAQDPAKYSFEIKYTQGMSFTVTSESQVTGSSSVTGEETKDNTSSESWRQKYRITVIELDGNLPKTIELTVLEEIRIQDEKKYSPPYVNVRLPLARNRYGRLNVDRKRLENDDSYTKDEKSNIYDLEHGGLNDLFQQLDVNDEIFLPRKITSSRQWQSIPLAPGESWDIHRDAFLKHSGLKNGLNFKADSRSIKAKGTFKGVQDGVATLIIEASYSGANRLFEDCNTHVKTTSTVFFDLQKNFITGTSATMSFSFEGQAGPCTINGKGEAKSSSTITIH